MIHTTDTTGLVVITQMQPIAVLFTIPEDSLPAVLRRLRSNQKLPAEAYNRDNTAKLATGYLLTVDNEIDPTTGTSRLKAVFQNEDNALFPNQFVNIRLLLDVNKGVLVVPVEAIQRGPQGTFVYVVKEDKTAEVRPVAVGATEGNDASIRTGLSEGEFVVIDGQDKLQGGSKVDVREPGRRMGEGPAGKNAPGKTPGA